MTTLPYLTDAEIAGICDPLTMPSAQARHLRALGMLVKAKPNGKPLVARSEFERVVGAGRYAPANDSHQGPNVVALSAHLEQRGHHGKTAKRG